MPAKERFKVNFRWGKKTLSRGQMQEVTSLFARLIAQAYADDQPELFVQREVSSKEEGNE